MSRTVRWMLLWALAAGVLLALFIGAALVWGVPYDQVSIVVNGERIELPAFTTGHWLVASAVVLFVLTVLALVVPVVIALALVVPVALFAAALAFGAVGTALALSPLLLLAWLLWWLWRRSRGPAVPPAAAGPTAQGEPAGPRSPRT